MNYDSLERKVLSDQARETGPIAWIRSLGRPVRVAIVGALLAAASIAFWIAKPRVDLDAYPTGRLAAILASYALVALVASWIAFRPLYRASARAPLVLAWIALAALAPIAVALLPELTTFPGPAARYRTAYHALVCFGAGASIGLFAALAACVCDRGAHRAIGPALLGAVAGGVGGVAALQIECPFNYRTHLLLGHASVPIGLVIGYGIGAAIVSRRRAAR